MLRLIDRLSSVRATVRFLSPFILKFVTGIDAGFILRTKEGEDGRQKEDGKHHPEEDDEQHDLAEGLKDVGGGGGEHHA